LTLPGSADASRAPKQLTRRQILGGVALFASETALRSHRSTLEWIGQAEANSMKVQPGSKVLVVGAGMAGLASAARLREHGYEVVILEARNRTGGRVHTIDTFCVPIDLGASWLHGGPQNPLRQLARHHGVQTRETDYRNTCVYVDGRVLTISDLDPALCRFEKSLYTWRNLLSYAGAWLALHVGIGVSHTSMGTFIDRAAAHLGQTDENDRVAVRLARTAIGSGSALPVDELSIAALLHESRTGGKEAECVNGRLEVQPEPFVLSGMKTITDAVGKGLAVRLNEVVERVVHRDGHVSIKTSQATHEAAAAVITVPLGVLKKGKIIFDPPLPASHQGALDRLEMGTFNKIVLEFPHAFWPTEPDLIALLDPGLAVPFFVNLQRYTERPILLGFAGGGPGRGFTGRASDEIVGRVTKDLRGSFGDSVCDPVSACTTDWVNDPFACGSFSTSPLGVTGGEAEILSEPIGNTLFLAGEAIHSTDPATVHGAFWSGRRAADQIAGMN